MKILFVGVFDNNKKSTNTSQIIAFKKQGHEIYGYNYRKKAAQLGSHQRDLDLISTINNRPFDLIIFSKCNSVSYEVFRLATESAKTCLWFMDPLISFNEEMKIKTGLVSFCCFDKKNVYDQALNINKNCFIVEEGYDSDVDKQRNVDFEYDTSFIGSIYGERQSILDSLTTPVKHITNAFGEAPSYEVSKTKINLNICTSHGASDRVYKILAAGGFLLTNDWEGRKLIDKKHCVIFDDSKDLQEKISYYLANFSEAQKIAKQGQEEVKKYTRENWARRIVEISHEI